MHHSKTPNKQVGETNTVDKKAMAQFLTNQSQ